MHGGPHSTAGRRDMPLRDAKLMNTGLRLLARSLRLAWLIAMLSLVGLVALPHVLPATGHDLFIVRGGSMVPTVPVGGVVIVAHADPASITTGDVITFRTGNGTVVTHRVISTGYAGEWSYATQGDANRSADPVTVSAPAVIGRVALILPYVGNLMIALGTTAGTIVALGILASLLLGAWFIEELVSTRRAALKPTAVAEPAL